jgi:hypothetical protein
VHQYFESVRDDGGWTAGEEGSGEGVEHAAVGENVIGAGVARGDGLLREGWADALFGSTAVSGGGVWMHDVYWELGTTAVRCFEVD